MKLGCGLALAVALISTALPARAHQPQALGVALTPDAASVALAMPGFGFVMRTAQEAPFVYLCNNLLGTGPTDTALPMVFLGDGSLLVGSTGGVRVVAPNGCPLAAGNELGTTPVIQLAAPPNAMTAYAVAAGSSPGLWRTTDGGQHWQAQAPLGDVTSVTSLVVSSEAPDTIYLSETTAQGTVVRASTDAGVTLTAYPQGTALTLIDVQSGGRLWAKARDATTVGNRGWAILRADGPAGPWQTVTHVGYFGGFVIDAEGVISIGEQLGGVFRSADDGLTFQRLSPDVPVACLARAGDALWACTPDTLRFARARDHGRDRDLHRRTGAAERRSNGHVRRGHRRRPPLRCCVDRVATRCAHAPCGGRGRGRVVRRRGAARCRGPRSFRGVGIGIRRWSGVAHRDARAACRRRLLGLRGGLRPRQPEAAICPRDPDEIVILLRGITALRHLHHVEPELRSDMLGFIFRVLDGIAELRPQLRVFNRHGLVNRRVAGNVGCIVREGAHGERILIRVLTLQQHLVNKVPAANIVGEIAELPCCRMDSSRDPGSRRRRKHRRAPP